MFIVLALLSVFCASVPMIGFLFLVWWLDRHDREPLWLFLLTFAWGAIAAIGLALVGSTLAAVPFGALVGPELADRYAAVVIAPLVEEPAKALVLFAVLFSRHFDNATDGFVYGAAAGLGFGMTENFLYFTTVAATGDAFTWVETVVIRTLYSGVMHGAATSCVGAALGFARWRGWFARAASVPVGFAIAMGIHALWNGLLTLDELNGTQHYTTANFVFFPIEVATVFAVFQLALWEERATLRRELADEVAAGLLPLAHASAIGSWWRRSRQGWLPAGIPQLPYVRAVTRLAFRKHQCRRASAREYPLYAEDVLRLRREVEALRALARPA